MKTKNYLTPRPSPEEIVKKFIALIQNSTLQELFSIVKENPSAVKELNEEQIRSVILDPLDDRTTQKIFKNILETLSSLEENFALIKEMADTIALYYNEFSSENPSPFSVHSHQKQENYPATKSAQPYTILPIDFSDDITATVGNPCPWRISELIREDSPVNKPDIINMVSQRLIVDMFKIDKQNNVAEDRDNAIETDNLEIRYSAEQIKKFLKTFTVEHLQYKIYNDFSQLKERQQKILGKIVLKGYIAKSHYLSTKLEAEHIKNFTVLHRNMLAELVKSYQDKESPKNNFYYLSGIKNNRIVISTKNLEPFEDIIQDPKLLEEISGFLKDYAERDQNDKGQEDLLRERRYVLTEKIKMFVEHKICTDDPDISLLLPDNKNDPAKFIESGGSFAIPITVTGIDPTIKINTFKKLFPGEQMELGFDVGYLIHKSIIDVNEGAIVIEPRYLKKSGIYPVILYDNVAIIIHDFSELKEMISNSLIKNTLSQSQNSSPVKELAGMFHALFSDDTKNIYHSTLIEGTQSSRKTQYKKDYPDKNTEQQSESN